jgi:hypothetical protein
MYAYMTRKSTIRIDDRFDTKKNQSFDQLMLYVLFTILLCMLVTTKTKKKNRSAQVNRDH